MATTRVEWHTIPIETTILDEDLRIDGSMSHSEWELFAVLLRDSKQIEYRMCIWRTSTSELWEPYSG